MLSKNTVNTIDGGVSDELLEVCRLQKEVADVDGEDDVVGGNEVSLLVLVVSALGDGVGQLPGIAALALGIGHVFPFGFLNVLVHAHIDKGLLVEVGLVDVTHQLLGSSLYAERSDRLDQLRTLG